jgi:hypothetical protein
VHEGLGQVSAQLALVDVVFLGVQAGRAACRAVALEPACRGAGVAELLRGLDHPEPAQQERALALMQRPGVMAEPVHVPAAGDPVLYRADGRAAARVVGRQGSADHRQQQRGIDARALGLALPAARRMDRLAEARQQRAGQGAPLGRPTVPGPPGRAQIT